MRIRDIQDGPSLDALACLLVAFGSVLGCSGCHEGGPIDRAYSFALAGSGAGGAETLLVATSWSGEERRRLEAEFQKQFAGRLVPESSSVRIVWLPLSPSDDLQRILKRFHRPDILLGGPSWSYVKLARAGELEPLGGKGSPAWLVARRSTINLVGQSDSVPTEALETGGTRSMLGDPRVDPRTLAWADGLLRSGTWTEGYARLVHHFGTASGRVGWLAGSIPGGLARPTEAAFLDGVPWEEGVAISRHTRHLELARRFLETLAGSPDHGSTTGHAVQDLEVIELEADLLGATLIDARVELRDAWTALNRAGSPSTAKMWMTESPPWPPASVEKILDRGGENGLALVQTLAEQIAPDRDLRLWLQRSWLAPRRLIDRRLLEELCQAKDGRLVREPRFRAWLRAEWTAWARQRYRRVARLAAAEAPAGGQGTTSRPASSTSRTVVP